MRVPPCAYTQLSGWLRNHAVAASLIVLFCSTGPRVFLAWRAAADPVELVASIPDAGTYLASADNLIAAGTFRDYEGEPDVSRTPGYPVFLAVIMSLVGWNLRAVLIAQAIVLSSGVLILYWLSRKILPQVMALTACLLAAFSPWGAVLAGLPLSDGLFLALLALIFLSIKFVEESSSLVSRVFGSAWVGLLTGGAVLVRPIWPLVIFVAGALLFRYGFKRKGIWVLLIAMLVCASTPLSLWKERNRREGQLNSLSDIPGKTVWRYLASRVTAEANGQNRHKVSSSAYQEERNWGLLSRQEADNERWRRAMVIFREHPLLTVYSFTRSAVEHTIHPSPDILAYARLNFSGDFIVLAGLWTGLLILAFFGSLCERNPAWDDGTIDRSWLLTILVICGLLTLSSGISFGAGSRLRAPLELIIPLLAGIGLSRAAHAFRHIPSRHWSCLGVIPRLAFIRGSVHE